MIFLAVFSQFGHANSELQSFCLTAASAPSSSLLNYLLPWGVSDFLCVHASASTFFQCRRLRCPPFFSPLLSCFNLASHLISHHCLLWGVHCLSIKSSSRGPSSLLLLVQLTQVTHCPHRRYLKSDYLFHVFRICIILLLISVRFELSACLHCFLPMFSLTTSRPKQLARGNEEELEAPFRIVPYRTVPRLLHPSISPFNKTHRGETPLQRLRRRRRAKEQA
ncbi:hypothetical protein BKA80DRAFT_12083 [Phyllosticta citrichinensis]